MSNFENLKEEFPRRNKGMKLRKRRKLAGQGTERPVHLKDGGQRIVDWDRQEVCHCKTPTRGWHSQICMLFEKGTAATEKRVNHREQR